MRDKQTILSLIFKTMMASEFTTGLQQVASEMKLTKNIFTSATNEQLKIAANACTVETYKWESSVSYFLLKDGQLKEAKLFDNNEEIDLSSNGMDAESLYEDFRLNGVKL